MLIIPENGSVYFGKTMANDAWRWKMVGKNKLRAFKGMLGGALGIPGEITLNLPLVTLIGCDEINIENFKGIIEYGEERVRIGTASGVLRLSGKGMVLKKITDENITIHGTIFALEYLP